MLIYHGHKHVIRMRHALGKPPRKATQHWSHLAPHAPEAVRVDQHKLSNLAGHRPTHLKKQTLRLVKCEV
jgi:hypothetical protein